MKLVAWNCRGLGNSPAVRGLRDLVKVEEPDILFLSETKLDEKRMQRFRWMLGLTNMVVKKCEGQGRGIAVLWRSGVNVPLRNYSRLHIDMEIKEVDGYVWRFTAIYGESHMDRKEETWLKICELKQQMDMTWMCAGDFNEVLYAHEKQGGDKDHKLAWINLRRLWRYVSCMILVLRGIYLLGESIIIGRRDI